MSTALLAYIAVFVTYAGLKALAHLKRIETEQNLLLGRIRDELQKMNNPDLWLHRKNPINAP